MDGSIQLSPSVERLRQFLAGKYITLPEAPTGAGGGGKGGGSSTTRVPTEDPNNVRSKQILRFAEILSEGPIKGWVHTDDWRKNVYTDNTVLIDPDTGTVNVEGVALDARWGTPDQPPQWSFGFNAFEKYLPEAGGGALIEAGIPVTRTTIGENNPDTTAVRVLIYTPAFIYQNKENGNVSGVTISMVLRLKPTANPAWSQEFNIDIGGKTNSPFTRQYFFNVGGLGAGPWTVQIERITPNNEGSEYADKIYLSGLVEVCEYQLSYPDTAYVYGTVDTSLFKGPTGSRSYLVDGLCMDVPDNYFQDPVSVTNVVLHSNNPTQSVWSKENCAVASIGDVDNAGSTVYALTGINPASPAVIMQQLADSAPQSVKAAASWWFRAGTAPYADFFVSAGTDQILCRVDFSGTNPAVEILTPAGSGITGYAPEYLSHSLQFVEGGEWRLSLYFYTPDTYSALWMGVSLPPYLSGSPLSVLISQQQMVRNTVANGAYIVTGAAAVAGNSHTGSRVYFGQWDGVTFKFEYSNNPAWFMLECLTNPRFGCGLSLDDIEVADFYLAARWCDGFVPDGNGGTEPRFTINTVINSRAEAFQLLAAVASIFNGAPYWANGKIRLMCDMPSDPDTKESIPVKLVTPDNVKDGVFIYEGADLKVRHNLIKVSWNNPDKNYEIDWVLHENLDNIEVQGGVVELETAAFGCTSRGQALRKAKWILDTEEYTDTILHYVAAWYQADLVPGNLIEVADPDYAGATLGGSVTSATDTAVTVFESINLRSGYTYTLKLVLSNGTIVNRTLTNSGGVWTKVLTFTDPLPALPIKGGAFTVSSSHIANRMFRVITVEPTEEGEVKVSALAHDANKYDRVENDIVFTEVNYSILDTLQSRAPTIGANAAVTRLYLVDGIPRASGIFTWSAPVIVQDGQVWNEDTAVYESKPVLVNDPRVSFYEFQMRRAYSLGGSVAEEAWRPAQMVAETHVEAIDIESGKYIFRVRAVFILGHTSPWVESPLFELGLGLPPHNVDESSLSSEVSVYGLTIRWRPVPDADIDYYDVRYLPQAQYQSGASWDHAWPVIPNAVPQEHGTESRIEGNSVTIPALAVGFHVFMVKAVDTSGVASVIPAVITVEITEREAPNVRYWWAGDSLVLAWDPPAYYTQIAYYKVQDGVSTDERVSATTLSIRVSWVGERTFTVTGYSSGDVPTASASVTVDVVIPGAVNNLTATAHKESVLVDWDIPTTGVLPIAYYIVKSGSSTSTWASATERTRVNATAAFIMELSLGTYRYWVAAVDTAGNEGVARSTTARVTGATDYGLSGYLPWAWTGTFQNVAVAEEGLYFPLIYNETFATHFSSHSWADIAAADAGISGANSEWIKPFNAAGAGDGYYQEVFDYGVSLTPCKITVVIDSVIFGSMVTTCQIEHSTDNSNWTVAVANGTEAYVGVNFRYIRVTMTMPAVDANAGILIRYLAVYAERQVVSDEGTASIANGVGIVGFNKNFLSIDSVNATVDVPAGAARMCVINVVIAGGSNGFSIWIYDANGTQETVTRTIYWTARGTI